jgi:hypothetical protein
LNDVLNSLNGLLNNTDLSDVSAESAGFSELPDGYYLAEVEKAELKESKSSHQPMVAFQFKITDDGLTPDENGDLVSVKKTKGRKIFIYYVLKDENSVRRFATDMLKFEGENPGEPILSKDYFTNSELLVDALDILKGCRVYIQSSTTINDDDSTSVWKNLISWKRASALELPL